MAKDKRTVKEEQPVLSLQELANKADFEKKKAEQDEYNRSVAENARKKAVDEARNQTQREKELTKELATPLTDADKERMAELEKKANAHGMYMPATPDEMLELGRLRQRAKLTIK